MTEQAACSAASKPRPCASSPGAAIRCASAPAERGQIREDTISALLEPDGATRRLRRGHRHGRRDRPERRTSRRASRSSGNALVPERRHRQGPAVRAGHPRADRARAQLRGPPGRAVQGRGVLRGEGRRAPLRPRPAPARAARPEGLRHRPRPAEHRGQHPVPALERGLRVPLEQPRHRACRAGLQRDPLGRGGDVADRLLGHHRAAPRLRSCGTTRDATGHRADAAGLGDRLLAEPAAVRQPGRARGRGATSTCHAASRCRSSSSTSSTGPGTASGDSTPTSGPTPPAWWRGSASAASA